MFDYVLCDLDGTILYDWERHYSCYCDIVKKYGGSCVTMPRYMELKRKRIKRTVLLEETQFAGTYEEFAREWLARIETKEYLRYETMKPDALQILQQWKARGARLILVTMRRNMEELNAQLKLFNLKEVFDEICSGDPTAGIKKAQLLSRPCEGSILVLGDTEADEELARALKGTFVMFTDGLREPKDIIADDYVSNWAELLEKI